jgi:hypothetical protein
VTAYLCKIEFFAVPVMKTKYLSWTLTEKELQVTISSVTPQFCKLCAKKEGHPSHKIRHVPPAAHKPLQNTLLVSNIKLSTMLNMLHLITNIAAHLQLKKLCFQK